MAICGYNARMGDGIRVLFDGMYQAVATKSQQENIPISAVVLRETLEISEINKVLSLGSDTSVKMFFGLNIMALSLFSELVKLNPLECASEKGFKLVVEDFLNVLESTENYSETLPPAMPQTDDAIKQRASAIADWILRNHFSSHIPTT